MNACAATGIEPVIAMGREAHHPTLAERFAEDPAPPQDPSPVASMCHRLQTKAGKARNALRKQTPEPVFGIIKSVLGFRQFMLRGLNTVRRMEPRDHGVEHEADLRPLPPPHEGQRGCCVQFMDAASHSLRICAF